MADIFSETSRQFGLPVGLLLVAVLVLARVAFVLYRDLQTRTDREIAELKATNLELEAKIDLYRERWIEAIGAAEVGERTSQRLARGGRRPPTGGR